MRQRRHKRVRKAVRFFKVCFQFREPYKVLLDGNFLHACVQLKLGDVREAVAKLLGASVRVFVTKCAQAELRALGADYAETLAAARRLDGLSGDLEPPASAAASIAAAVGGANAQHFFVGTQDAALREQLRQIPGVPLLFVHSTGVGLELPTEEQRHDAETHGVVPTHERVALALEPGAATRVHTNVQFKRNKAKGPNPLAVKKKIAKPAAQGAQAAEGGERQRKRVRKRRGGGGDAAAAAA